MGAGALPRNERAHGSAGAEPCWTGRSPKGSASTVAFADKCWPAFPAASALSPAMSYRSGDPGIPCPARWISTRSVRVHRHVRNPATRSPSMDINNSAPASISMRRTIPRANFDYHSPTPHWLSTAATPPSQAVRRPGREVPADPSTGLLEPKDKRR